MRELAKARLLLAGSYVFAYFMTDVSAYSVNVFHFLQVLAGRTARENIERDCR